MILALGGGEGGGWNCANYLRTMNFGEQLVVLGRSVKERSAESLLKILEIL